MRALIKSQGICNVVTRACKIKGRGRWVGLRGYVSARFIGSAQRGYGTRYRFGAH